MRFFFVFYCIAFAAAANEHSVLEMFLVPFRSTKMMIFNILYARAESARNMELLKNRRQIQQEMDRELPCPLNNTRSGQVPSSVHHLRPGDIDVIAAIGDSLSAGVGLLATDLLQIAIEFRGISPTGGGKGTWRQFTTLPNILKTFNPNLTGYSTDTSSTLHRASRLNVAETGAISENMPYMAKVLVKRILSDPLIDVQNHWKMISILIGPNDFCSGICFKKLSFKQILKEHKKDLVDVLTIFKANLPRTIINLIPVPNVKQLSSFTNKPTACIYSHLFECPCLCGPSRKLVNEDEYVKLIRDWQELDKEIGNIPDFDTEDFTVVVQPFSINFSIPLKEDGISTDFSYMAVDCFHQSQKGNAKISVSLWNNLLEPVGKKRHEAFDTNFIKCPTEENPYIFTRRNS